MKMKICNVFGIKPTNSFCSAGSDYYVPNIKAGTKQMTLAYKAFEKSYGLTAEEILSLHSKFSALFDDDPSQAPNLVHLYLALYNSELDVYKNCDDNIAIMNFLNEYVVYDPEKHVVGIRLKINDTLFINSGIKVALNTVWDRNFDLSETLNLMGIGVAGLYVNKSGKGNAGFDTRACLVDEDYSGFVHLSMAYTKDVDQYDEDCKVFAGDKLVQMMLIPIFHTDYEEISEDEYNNIMSDSERGDNGFGSTDVNH